MYFNYPVSAPKHLNSREDAVVMTQKNLGRSQHTYKVWIK